MKFRYSDSRAGRARHSVRAVNSRSQRGFCGFDGAHGVTRPTVSSRSGRRKEALVCLRIPPSALSTGREPSGLASRYLAQRLLQGRHLLERHAQRHQVPSVAGPGAQPPQRPLQVPHLGKLGA